MYLSKYFLTTLLSDFDFEAVGLLHFGRRHTVARDTDVAASVEYKRRRRRAFYLVVGKLQVAGGFGVDYRTVAADDEAVAGDYDVFMYGRFGRDYGVGRIQGDGST